MLKKLRRIVVNGESFLWRWRYDGHADCLPSYLLILLENDRRAELRIKFYLTGNPIEICMLNSGFKAIKNDEEFIVNFNEPKYIAEIIQYLMENKVDFSKEKRYIFENGEQLLNEMGYDF